MNNKIKLEPIKPFTRFLGTIGELPTSYLISMTYEEQLLWFCNFLEKTVIPTLDNTTEAVIELQNYVANYFDNLDVQDEIDHKLDEMADSGELAEIIASYLELKTLLIFDTVSDMKSATNLIDGSTVETLGFYSANDGGGAKYKIRSLDVSDSVDEMYLIALTDENLVAELLIKDNELNIKQVGVKGLISVNDTDKIRTALQKEFSVYFPTGRYYIDNQIIITHSNKTIRGDGMFKTIFKMANNQDNNESSYFTTVYDASTDITSYNLTFKDFSINAGTQNVNRYVLSPYQVKGLNIENVEIYGGLGYATRFNLSEDIYINNLYIHDVFGGEVSGSNKVGGAIYGMNMKNVRVNNSLIENVGDHAFYILGKGTDEWSYCKNIELNNIICKNTGVDGYTAGGAITIYGDTTNVTIVNSIIEDCKQSIHITKYSDVDVSPKNITISNNVIKNSYNDGIYCEGLTTDPVKDITITNNIIDTTNVNEGISLRRCDSVLITGNVIKNVTRIGIEVLDTNNSIINNNILKNNINHIWVGSRTGFTYADNNVISNNNIYNDESYSSGNSGLYISAISTNCIALNNNINNTGNYNYNVRGSSNKSILQTMNNTQTNLTKKVLFSSSIPSGNIDAEVGDICFNTGASAGGSIGWVCVEAGTPGTWKTFGAISS